MTVTSTGSGPDAVCPCYRDCHCLAVRANAADQGSSAACSLPAFICIGVTSLLFFTNHILALRILAILVGFMMGLVIICCAGRRSVQRNIEAQAYRAVEEAAETGLGGGVVGRLNLKTIALRRHIGEAREGAAEGAKSGLAFAGLVSMSYSAVLAGLLYLQRK